MDWARAVARDPSGMPLGLCSCTGPSWLDWARVVASVKQVSHRCSTCGEDGQQIICTRIGALATVALLQSKQAKLECIADIVNSPSHAIAEAECSEAAIKTAAMRIRLLRHRGRLGGGVGLHQY